MPHSKPLQDLTDRCVLCGLCSQHCPTYALTAVESESPRGRIALINAANQGQLTLEAESEEHLAHCVGCRSCEAFCPSGVQFGEILDQGMDLANRQPPASLKSLLKLLTQPAKFSLIGRLLGVYQRWGLQWLARRSGILKLLGLAEREALLPKQLKSHAFPDYSPPVGEKRADVALFTGCVSRLADHQALNATRLLLNQLGYGVHNPASQGCCGALHQHNGDPASAQQLATNNLQAFAKLEIESIVHTATGCTTHLSEYAQHLGTDEAHSFSGKVQDINTFLGRLLDEHHWPARLQFKPLPQHVLVHEPCSQRNVLKGAGQAQKLLSLIPELEITTLPRTLNCCGAGGGYMLSQTDFSRRMREATLADIGKTNADSSARILVTSNVGCALQLGAGLREQDDNLEVLHPVALLARQLGLEP